MKVTSAAMTRDEVAQHLGCSTQTVANIEARALTKVRDWLRKHGLKPGDLFVQHADPEDEAEVLLQPDDQEELHGY